MCGLAWGLLGSNAAGLEEIEGFLAELAVDGFEIQLGWFVYY